MAHFTNSQGIYSFTQTFRLKKCKFEKVIKKIGIVFIGNDKSNSVESFCPFVLSCFRYGVDQRVIFSSSPIPRCPLENTAMS